MIDILTDTTTVTLAHSDSVRVLLDSVKVTLQNSPIGADGLLKDWVLPIVAIIGVITGLVGTILQHRQGVHTIGANLRIASDTIKADLISSSRLKWIDSLRDQLAEFISVSESLRLLCDGKEKKIDIDNGIQPWRDVLDKLNFVQSKIRLLINPNENDHQQLIEKCNEVLNTNFNKRKTAADIAAAIEDMIQLSQKILKREWERVKKFE